MPPRPKTIKDIAQATGYSVTTVSQALRGVGRISADSVALIRKTATKLGYHPNLFAAGLRSASARAAGAHLSVGVIRHRNEYPIEEFMVELRAHCKIVGAYLREAPEPDAAQVPALLRKWRNAGVQALILPGQGPLVERHEDLLRDFAVVVVGRFLQSPHVTVSSESFAAIEHISQLAQERGYRRIGFALCQHPEPILDDREREGAWHRFASQTPAEQRVPAFWGGHADYKGFLQWASTHRPDLIVGFHEGHYYTLTTNGWELPRDAGFVCLHKSHIESQAFITGYREAYGALATAALTLVDSRIRHRVWQQTGREQWHMLHRDYLEGTTFPDRTPGRG